MARAGSALRRFPFSGLALDPRSLTLFRVGLAALLLVDVVERWLLWRTLYGREGVLDLSTWVTVFADRAYDWTFHGDDPLALHLLLVVHGALLVCVLLGVRVRATAFGAWLLTISLDARNPLLAYGGEKLSALLLLALVCAYRPVRGEGTREPPSSAAWGGLLLRSQLVITYVAAGIAKMGDTSWASGDALAHALRMDSLVKPFGVWLAAFESPLHVASVATPYFEILVPWLLIVPSSSPPGAALVGAGVLLLLAFNLGIFLTLDVGYFMPFATIALLALVPGRLWSLTVASRAAGAVERLGALVPSEESAATRLRAKALAILLLVVFWTTAIDGAGLVRVPWSNTTWNLVRAAHLYQNWGLFTDPPKIPRWYVARATLADGSTVDVLRNGAAIDFRRKHLPPHAFEENFRWRLIFAKASSHWREEHLRQAVARGLAGWWNARHPAEKQIERLEIFRMTAPGPDEYEKRKWRMFAEWSEEGASG